MIHADQHALLQEANRKLLHIRISEIEYLTGRFSEMGTTSQLIAGFTLTSLIELNVNDFEISIVWKYIYWISAIVCMTSCFHCVLTTEFLGFFANSLAIRGPPGSMVRAIKGMHSEKRHIFISYVFSIITFIILVLSLCWVLMRFSVSLTCSVIVLIAALYWYKYCRRIYRRFFYIESSEEESRMQRDSVSELPTTAPSPLLYDLQTDSLDNCRTEQIVRDSYIIIKSKLT